MLKTSCGDCGREIGTYAKNPDGSYGVKIVRIPGELCGDYCEKCGSPRLEAYMKALSAKGDHRVEVAGKRTAALEKARAVRKAKKAERERRATEKCGRCGHTLAICVCPPVEEKALVGTLNGEVL